MFLLEVLKTFGLLQTGTKRIYPLLRQSVQRTGFDSHCKKRSATLEKSMASNKVFRAFGGISLFSIKTNRIINFTQCSQHCITKNTYLLIEKKNYELILLYPSKCVPGGPAFDYTYYNTYTAIVGSSVGWISIVVFQVQAVYLKQTCVVYNRKLIWRILSSQLWALGPSDDSFGWQPFYRSHISGFSARLFTTRKSNVLEMDKIAEFCVISTGHSFSFWYSAHKQVRRCLCLLISNHVF